MSPAALRRAFLVPRLFEPGRIRLRETRLDGLVAGGAMPLEEPLRLPARGEFGGEREVGIINIGDPGSVTVEGQTHTLDRLDGLYVGSGSGTLFFEGQDGSRPAYYLLSCPAHTRHPTRKVSRQEAQAEDLGNSAQCSKRRLLKYIHPGGVSSCQLLMGVTEIEDHSVWNTMPPHTHVRRSEIYFYFGLGDQIVVHLMGPPGRTRHLIVRNKEAVLAPRWSIHSGVGTGAYRFIWGMAGDNRDFADIAPVGLSSIR